MQRRRYLQYTFIFCAHLAIAMVAFIGFRLHPGNTVFYDIGDGMKNIFTLVSYVKEPLNEGLFKYNSFQYPFGDYIYYTDNDPILAMPLKWFSHHVYDITGYTVIILNLTVILNIALCGMLLFYVFRKLVDNELIALLLALILPWVNMQVFRIWAGHYAFSYSSFTVFAIVLFMLWHKYRGNGRKQLLVAGGMTFFSFITFLGQGYYLAIITIFLASCLFVYGIYNWRTSIGKRSIVISLIYSVAAFAITISIIALTDKYLPLRKEAANGYDWMAQKVRFMSLFSKYEFQHIGFPFYYGPPRIADPETAAYLGNVGVYALAVLLLMLVRKEWRTHIWQAQKQFFGDPLKGSLFLGSLIMLFISFGEHYSTGDNPGEGWHLTNFLNPLYYIHFFTKRVEQFRSLERFVWPFYFCFYIWIGYTLAYLIKQYGKTAAAIVAICIAFLGGAEVVDYVNATQRKCEYPNPFNSAALARVKPQHVNFGEFQAIIPIPYYFAGSEDYNYTINDESEWSKQNYQLSYMSGLPLMSCKMSRTPPVFNVVLMDMMTRDSLADALKQKLNDKPILVMVNRRRLADSNMYNVPDPGTPQADLYWKAMQFASRNQLNAIDSVGDVIYYSWKR